MSALLNVELQIVLMHFSLVEVINFREVYRMLAVSGVIMLKPKLGQTKGKPRIRSIQLHVRLVVD